MVTTPVFSSTANRWASAPVKVYLTSPMGVPVSVGAVAAYVVFSAMLALAVSDKVRLGASGAELGGVSGTSGVTRLVSTDPDPDPDPDPASARAPSAPVPPMSPGRNNPAAGSDAASKKVAMALSKPVFRPSISVNKPSSPCM